MSVLLLLPRNLHPVVLWGISPSFPGLSPALGLITYVLLTRPPLSYYSVLLLPNIPVRLACVRHAASVRSEPGSNSHLISGLLKLNELT